MPRINNSRINILDALRSANVRSHQVVQISTTPEYGGVTRATLELLLEPEQIRAITLWYSEQRWETASSCPATERMTTISPSFAQDRPLSSLVQQECNINNGVRDEF